MADVDWRGRDLKDDASSGRPELVIVRRRAGDDAGAGKAGSWKIAYADFVTAMMAFFLVMWLINASNEETRAQVASYFNPIKLTDTSTGERSLKDINESKSTDQNGDSRETTGAPLSGKELDAELKLLTNPLESLEEVASKIPDLAHKDAGLEKKIEIAPALSSDNSNPGVGDPFDPRTWEKLTNVPPRDPEQQIRTDTPAHLGSDPAQPERTSTMPDMREVSPAAAETSPRPQPVEDRAAENKRERGHQFIDEAVTIAREISSRLGPSEDALKNSFSVTPTSEGILVSLTEGKNFEMFKTGSAEPKPETLRLVEVIAGVIQSRGGELVIRGHTDSRPYRNRYYDNWQLSTARAHFARYMLVRSGLDEKRIRRIEGVADREPRNVQDPQAPENRRIDILISGANQ